MARLNPEAIKQSREALHNDQSPGAVTLHMAVLAFENGWYANFPTPRSPEARDFMDWLKAPRFAATAKPIDLMLEKVFEESKTSVELGRAHSSNDKWTLLESYFTSKFLTSIYATEKTKPFSYLERVNKLSEYLLDLDDLSGLRQLGSGANTARKTNIKILKLFPDLIEHYAPETPQDRWGGIAKKSSSLSYSLGRRSVESFIAGRKIVVEDPDPSKFLPIYRDGILEAFRFNQLEGQVVPKGYKPLSHARRLENPTTVGEIESLNNTIIGCPATLLNGRFRQLWEWMAETADKSGVWGSQEVSGTSLAGTAENVNL